MGIVIVVTIMLHSTPANKFYSILFYSIRLPQKMDNLQARMIKKGVKGPGSISRFNTLSLPPKILFDRIVAKKKTRFGPLGS